MTITNAPPLKMHLTPLRAESGPGALHPKTHSPESKTCTVVLLLTTVSPTHLRASEDTDLLYKTSDNLCERWSSRGHNRPAPSPRGRRMARRGSGHWCLWEESILKAHHLLVPLHPVCRSNDPPLQGLSSKTAGRRFFSCQYLKNILNTCITVLLFHSS